MPLQNIKRGAHFGFLTGMRKGMWIVQTISYTGTPTPESHRPKLGLRSTSLNAIIGWCETTATKIRPYTDGRYFQSVTIA